jgi:hypothetical protein
MLLRRREIWWPTLQGWLLLLVLIGGIGAAVALGIVDFLAVVEPARGADGRGARTLVVEGWLEERDLIQAVALARAGRYERVLASGGPIDSWNDTPMWKNYAQRAAATLKAHGLVQPPVIAVPAPASAQERTFLSAVQVREWLRTAGVGVDAIDVYTTGVHARRSRLLYRMAFGPGVEIGVLAPKGSGGPQAWWSSSDSAKGVLGELIGLAWTTCCFWPGPPGSHEEHWAVPPPR